MKYQIKNIGFIDGDNLNKLKSVNILNTDNLLDKANTESKRTALNIKTGISLNEIEHLVSVSDLVRIKGVAIKTANELINSCKLKTVQEIAQFNIINTSNDIDKANKYEKKIKNYSIPRKRFLEIAEEAAELKPRLIFEDTFEKNKIQKKFIAEIDKQINTSIKWEIKTLLILFSLILVLVSSLTAVYFIPIYLKYEHIDQLLLKHYGSKLIMPAFWLRILNLFGDVAIVLLFIVLFILLWKIVERKIKKLSYIFFFKENTFKSVYIQLDFQKLVNNIKKSNKQLLIASCLFIASIVTIFVIDKTASIDSLKIPFIVFLLFLIVLLYYKTYKFYNKLNKLQTSFKEVYQRIQFITQIHNLFSLILLLLALNVVIPLAFDSINLFEKEVIIKTSNEKFLDALQKVNIHDAKQEESVTKMLRNFYSFSSTLNSDNGIESVKLLFQDHQDILISVFWAIIVALILSFSIPYFKFSGFRSGVTFILVICVSMFTSSLLSNNIGHWLFIEDSIYMKSLTVIVFSFWFAILFDWLYNLLSYNKKECPNCGNLMERHFKYCPKCGLVKN
ncbi:DUF4332 domain-containing protein [Labilibacter sediminis]|nr:DUF4332 domain-containing protein [Labilibacter sediminis]